MTKHKNSGEKIYQSPSVQIDFNITRTSDKLEVYLQLITYAHYYHTTIVARLIMQSRVTH